MLIDNIPADIEIVSDIDIIAAGLSEVVPTQETDLSVESVKKEYAIVGDGLFAKATGDDTPDWLMGTIDFAVNARLGSALSNLDATSQQLIGAISEIELARNSYKEAINISATIDSVVASRVQQLQASIDGVEAKVTEIDTAYVSETRAAVIAGEQISASLNTPSGALNGQISRIDSILLQTNEDLAEQYGILSDKDAENAWALGLLITEAKVEAENSLSTYSEEIALIIGPGGSLVERVEDIEAEFGGLSASLEEKFVAFANPDGSAGAKYTMNLKTAGVIGPNGLPATVIGGMVLNNNGTMMSAGFDVDTFWIGRAPASGTGGIDGMRPFEIIGNTTYIKQAVIPHISANKITTIGANPQEIFYIDGEGKTRISSDVIDTDMIQSKNWSAANKTGLQINLNTGEFTIYGAQTSGSSGYLSINNSGIRIYDTRTAAQPSIELVV